MNTQKGSITTEILLMTTATIIFIIWTFTTDQERADRVAEIRSNAPSITLDDRLLIDKYKALPVPEFNPSGSFYAEGTYDGHDYTLTYSFGDDQTIEKDMVINNKYFLTGFAKFHFEGSTLAFSEIAGDKVLFSPIGEAVAVPNAHLVMTLDPEYVITLKSSLMIEQEQRKAEKAAADREAYLKSKSIFELSAVEIIEKSMNDHTIQFIFFILVLSGFLKILHGFFHRRAHGL